MSFDSLRFNRRTLVAGAAALALGSVTGSSNALAQGVEENYPLPLRDPSEYTAYIPAVSKPGQFAG